MSQAPFLRVAIDVPLSTTFDYRAPRGAPLPPVGSRVRVPFGRRQETGIVMHHSANSELAPKRLKASSPALDDTALLTADDLWLLRFTSAYYHHPIGEVIAAALPAMLRHGKPLRTTAETLLPVSEADIDIDTLARRAPRQAELLALLKARGALPIADIAGRLPHWRRYARALADKGLVRLASTACADVADTPAVRPGPVLNADQAAAVAAVENTRGFAAFVLDGVTGSGKTEVYLKLIESTLARGRQVLVLVPEIGLTPQLVRRFETRLGFRPATLHSSLADSERLLAWRRARNGKAAILVGTRSAVFTPMPDVGLVIVDEEHDHSFKQQEGLRYSARDLAIVRAKRRGVPVVLGSATPTLEVLKHCEDGRYTRLTLPQRAGGAQAPTLRLVDQNRYASRDGVSGPLLNALDKHLDDGGQALLFLNRRGFAPTLICTSCAYVVECRRCDARMTIHARARELRCHHCGARQALESQCPECTGNLKPLGEGTERLEQMLTSAYPERRTVRIDSDSVQTKGALTEALELAATGEADILVGTQMLSKGHHFRRLTLVGVINADQGLFGSDFRSAERLAQSIVQVAGRAGRERRRASGERNRAGEVLIQTAFPEHPFWGRLFAAAYAGVAADALVERRASGWPPYARIGLIRASAHCRHDALACLEFARQQLDGFGGVRRAQPSRIEVFGPVDAPMARRAGRHRAQLLVKSEDRRALHSALGSLRRALEAAKVSRRARWSIDVDPVQLF